LAAGPIGWSGIILNASSMILAAVIADEFRLFIIQEQERAGKKEDTHCLWYSP
jgi:hypothetical protein